MRNYSTKSLLWLLAIVFVPLFLFEIMLPILAKVSGEKCNGLISFPTWNNVCFLVSMGVLIISLIGTLISLFTREKWNLLWLYGGVIFYHMFLVTWSLIGIYLLGSCKIDKYVSLIAALVIIFVQWIGIIICHCYYRMGLTLVNNTGYAPIETS